MAIINCLFGAFLLLLFPLFQQGNPRERTGKRFDPLPQPYKNDQEARFANNGALPPDLSVITNARHGGVDYIYALMTSYGRPAPGGCILSGTQYYNPYFHGGIIGMPPPLSDEMLEYSDGTFASVPQMAKDVSVFLEWCSSMLSCWVVVNANGFLIRLAVTEV